MQRDSKLELSMRAKRVLRNLLGNSADISRPEIIASISEEMLRQTMGCGVVTLREIQLWLSAHGLALAASEEQHKFLGYPSRPKSSSHGTFAMQQPRRDGRDVSWSTATEMVFSVGIVARAIEPHCSRICR
jgi:hypothetical protein